MTINSEIIILILAGSYDSRLDNFIKTMPKPLVKWVMTL